MQWMPVPALGGVNLFDDPRAIRDDEVQLARNLVPLKPGILKKRGGLRRPTRELSFTGIPSSAVMSPVPGSQIDMVLALRNATSGFAISVAGVAVNSPVTVSAGSPPFDHPRVPLLAWKNGVYLIPGPYADWMAVVGPGPGPSRFPYYLWDLTVESTASIASAGVAFQGTGNENVFPSIAAPYKQRLVLAHFGKGYENTIAFTDDFTADVVGNDLLASNGRAISLVAGADGDEIVAMIEVMLTNVGSPAEAGLLILRRYGDPFLLTGDMDQTGGGTSTLDIKRLSIRTGCAGHHTVVRTPVGIIWAGNDDVWCFAAGVLPHRLGQKIQPALRLTPVQLQYRWSAAYFDGFYRLAVWGAGQSMTVASAPGDQWWLDLREGLPQDWREARWWGPQQFLGGAGVGTAPIPQTFDLLAENRAGKDAKLYHIDYVTAGNPAILEGVICEIDPSSARDLTSTTSCIPDHDYVDPEVTAELVTKEYALSPARDQINDGLMMALRPSNDLTMNVDFILDDGDQVSARTKRIAGASQFQLDVSPLDTDRVTGKAIKTALYPQIRRAGQTHRFEISDTAGHTIVTGLNDSLVVQFQDSGASGILYQWIATIAAGTYSITDLATACVTAINAGKLFGNDWTSSFTAGVLTLTGGGPYATGMTMAIKFVGTTLVPPDVGTAATQAQLDACRRLMAILGYDTDGNTVTFGPSLNPVLAGSTAPFKKGISDWEIYGIAVNMEVLPRAP